MSNGGVAVKQRLEYIHQQICFVNTRRADFAHSRQPDPIQLPEGSVTTKDRFVFKFMYLGRVTRWFIVFQHGKFPPDFIFDEVPSFLPELSAIPSLLTWSPQRPDALYSILKELTEEFKGYQDVVLLNHPNHQIRDDYKELKLHENEYNVQATTFMNGTCKIPCVKMYVSLRTLHSELPHSALAEELESKPIRIVMSIIFRPQQDYPDLESKILNPPLAKEALASMDLPVWVRSAPLCNYVSEISDTIKEKLVRSTTSLIKRRQYIASFLSHFGSALLEYDVVDFKHISFLFEVAQFYAIVHIKVTTGFPEEKPSVVLQSIYSDKSSQPLKKSFPDYPWSPRWSSDEMAIRARTFLLDAFQQFRAEN